MEGGGVMTKCEWCGEEKEGVCSTRIVVDVQVATGLGSVSLLCEACAEELLMTGGE
jgi:hypothetical protein